MITSRHLRRCLRRLGPAGAAALLALLSQPLAAAEPALSGPGPALGLVNQCWPAAALAAREGEETPVRGAAGHARSIPRVALAKPDPTPAHLRGAIRRVKLPPGKNLVALTLDLCEQPGEIAGYDGPIFDYLRSKRIRATVFTGGKWFMTHAERSQQLIADPLFEIGNHGWAHRNVRGLAGTALQDEIRGPEAAFQSQRAALVADTCAAQSPAASQLQQRLGLYRFPFGACNRQALDALADNGLLAIQWDVSTGDSSKAETAQAIARTIVAEVRPGSIILAHANGRGHHTAAALPIAVAKLQAKGYTFVTVSELLAAGTPEIADTCYSRKPGDTDRYDVFFKPRAKPEPADATAASRLPR